MADKAGGGAAGIRMSNFRVLVPVGSPSSEVEGQYSYEMEALADIGVEFVECHKSEEAFVSAAKGVEVVYVRGVNVSRRMVEALDECLLIALGSVGVDYVDIETATEKRIPVTNCPDTFIEEVADHTMMLLLACHRRALEQDLIVREGRWDDGRQQLLRVPRLMGQIVGFGRVARAVALRALPFGLRIIACDPFVDETVITGSGVQPADIDEVLVTSDFVSLHLPATIETAELFDKQKFRRMKQTAIFVNTGRGTTVVESALVESLREGLIAGAGLDVFAEEPVDESNPLLNFTNVILSPHNASASDRFDPARKRRVGHEIALVLSGKWPMACVNPEVLPGTGLKRWR